MGRDTGNSILGGSGDERWFLGDAVGVVDRQRRFAIPAQWREDDAANNRFVLLPGRQCSLQLLPMTMFVSLIQKLRTVSFADPQAAQALAQIGAIAVECRADKQGRVMMTPKLMTHANITDKVTLVGAVTHIQVWTPESWERQKMDPDQCLDVIQGLQERPGPLQDTLSSLLNRP